jgi:hypothetical protein
VCHRRPAIAASSPGTKQALTSVFRPASDPRTTGRSYARVVTRKSADGGRVSPRVPKQAVEQGFSLTCATIGHDCRRPGCHRLVTSRVGRGYFRAPVKFAVASTSGDAAGFRRQLPNPADPETSSEVHQSAGHCPRGGEAPPIATRSRWYRCRAHPTASNTRFAVLQFTQDGPG